MKPWQFVLAIGVSVLTLLGVAYIASVVRDLPGSGATPTPAPTPTPTPTPTPIFFTGGCFHVVPIPPPGAHASTGDKYCVRENAGSWTLVPGEGLEEWHSIAGPKEIPLDVKVDDEGAFTAYFNLEVDGHSVPPPGDHGPRHEAPDFQFMLDVTPMSAGTTAVTKPRGRRGGPVHGGTAHSQQD